MTLRVLSNFLILSAMTLTAACGGGGGGGGGGSTPPPSGGGSTQVAISTGNATLAAAVGNAFLEAYTQLTISSLDNVFDLIESGELSVGMVCDGFGASGRITLTDNDSNGEVSAGDQLVLQYNNCFQDSLGDVVIGRVNIDVLSLTIGLDLSVAGEFDIQVPDDLTFDAGDGTFVDVDGSFRVGFVATPTFEDLAISTSTSQQLRIVLRDATTSLTETVRQVAIDRRFENDMYTITASFDVDSGTLGGEMDCDTTAEVIGDVSFLPTAGALTCVGRSRSAVRVVADGSGGINTQVDPEGDGTFVDAGVFLEGNGIWTDYVEGTLFFTQLDRPVRIDTGLPPELTSVSLGIDVVDAAYSAANDRLYVTDGTGMAVVDPATMTQVDYVVIDFVPGPVAVSDDGSTIWVGVLGSSEIVPIDAATLTEGTRVALGVGVRIPLDRFATFLRVAPGTTDTVIVASEGTREVIAYSGGAQLPNIVDEFGAATQFEFRDATTIVGIHDSSTSFAATLMSLGANGLVLDKNLQNYSQNFNTTLALDDGIAWISYGRAIDLDNELVLGRVNFDGSSFRDGIYVDNASDRVWFFNQFDGTLVFYDTNSFLALGRYRVQTNGDMVEMIGLPNGEVLLVLETEIHRVDLASPAPNYVRNCSTLDLGGQLGTAVYVQINCRFNDSVYDAGRDLIYASVPSAAGANGNSVAVIDPQTGTIQSFIPVGSEPDELSLSGGGTRLYVTLRESNSVAEVDLQTQQRVATVRLEDEDFSSGPGFAQAITASTQSETDFIMATEQGVGVYSNGARLPDTPISARGFVSLFYNSDATRAYAVDDNRNLWTFDVTATGLVNEVQTRNVMEYMGVKIENDLLYERLGAIIDPETAATVAICPASASAVEPDPASDDVYYLETGFDSVFYVCDENLQNLKRTFQVPRFDSSFFFPELTKAGSNRIAITNSDKMLLLDPTEF